MRVLLIFLLFQFACSANFDDEQMLKIVGGEDADIAQFPFMAGLFKKQNEELLYLCGASQITPGVLLSAAHCFAGDDELKQAEYFLAFHLQSLSHVKADQLVKVKHAIIHEGFDVRNLNSVDLALLFYESSFDPSSVTNASIQLADWPSDKRYAQDLALIIGHGVTDSLRATPAAQLQKLKLPRVDLETCRNVEKSSYASLDDGKLCYGFLEKEGFNACFQDSGDPLFVFDQEGKPLLLGVHSWGPTRCENMGEPGVYTRIAAYKDWIYGGQSLPVTP